MTNSLAIFQNQLSAPLIPFSGGWRRKLCILVSLKWPVIIFVFQVNIIFYTSPILTICVATSVDVERTFSKGQLLLSHIRNQLSAKSMRALLCLNNWTKQGYVKQEYFKEAAALPEVDSVDEAAEESDVDMMVL